MKKIQLFLFLCCVIVALSACGGGGNKTNETESTQSQDYRGGDEELYQADEENGEADVDAANEGDEQDDDER